MCSRTHKKPVWISIGQGVADMASSTETSVRHGARPAKLTPFSSAVGTAGAASGDAARIRDSRVRRTQKEAP